MPASPRLTPAEDRAWRALVTASVRLLDGLETQTQADAGIPHAHYGLLARLYDAPDRELRMSALAEAAGFSRSRLTHAVAALERSGWMRRSPDPDDRRGARVALTREGIAEVHRLAPLQIAGVRRPVLDAFDEHELEQLAELLQRLV